MYKITISIIISFIFINLKAQVPTKKDSFLITDDGTELFVQKSGDGPVCIFIHGGPGAWSKTFKDLGVII